MDLVKALPIFGLSMIDIWGAVPIAYVLKFTPIQIVLLTIVGSIVGILVIILIGEPIKRWLAKRHTTNRKESAIKRIWLKYGVIGLGLIAPIVSGSSIGMAVGLIFGAKTGKLLFWMSVGIIFWCIVLTYLGYLGILGIHMLKK